MIKDQGEVALMFERDDKSGKIEIVGYALPKNKEKFETKELRDVYLAQAINHADVEDNEREKVHKYFVQQTRPKNEEASSTARGVFSAEKVTETRKRVTRKVLKGKNPVTRTVLAGKKYKPVADKVRPVYQELPEKFRIVREIYGDPLLGMPELSTNPPEFTPTGRYTEARKEAIDKVHDGEFLWPEERKLVHQVFMQQNEAFAWDDTERGRFKTEYFPPVEMPVVEHEPWVLKNIPIPPGMYDRV